MDSLEQSAVSKTKAIILYIIVAMYLFFEMGVQVSPSVMTGALMRSLHLTPFGLGLMSGFYFYTYTFMQIPSGLLFDRFKPRYVISAAITTCSLGCIFFGFSTNIYLASAARLLMGMGSAFAYVAVLVVTADLFPSRLFAMITGITQMLGALGAMSGQMPLSYLLRRVGWRHTMFVLAGIGFVLALLVWFLLNYKKKFDYRSKMDKTSFIWSRLRNIMLSPQNWAIAAYAFLLWAPMSGFTSLWGVPFLIHVFKLSHQNAAFVCSIMWLGLALASPLTGWASTKYCTRVKPLAISALLGVIAFSSLLLFVHAPFLMVMLFLFLSGAACSGQALSFTVIKEINAPKERATAIAFNNMAVVISGAVFQPVLGRLLDFHCAATTLASCTISHYRLSMLLILGAYIIGFFIAAFFIKESVTARSFA